MTEIYHPKGSMCAICAHKDRDCSNLKFHSMHVLYRYQMDDEPIFFKVVLCGEFVK